VFNRSRDSTTDQYSLDIFNSLECPLKKRFFTMNIKLFFTVWPFEKRSFIRRNVLELKDNSRTNVFRKMSFSQCLNFWFLIKRSFREYLLSTNSKQRLTILLIISSHYLIRSREQSTFLFTNYSNKGDG
jgi:hypothetical protein